ncbi:MAG TPA: hypothetical protein VHA13_03445 [Gammaproteobacteria bacterium]|nr:hypothetical protein [Gammaproteobacteria bacterium]
MQSHLESKNKPDSKPHYLPLAQAVYIARTEDFQGSRYQAFFADLEKNLSDEGWVCWSLGKLYNDEFCKYKNVNYDHYMSKVLKWLNRGIKLGNTGCYYQMAYASYGQNNIKKVCEYFAHAYVQNHGYLSEDKYKDIIYVLEHLSKNNQSAAKLALAIIYSAESDKQDLLLAKNYLLAIKNDANIEPVEYKAVLEKFTQACLRLCATDKSQTAIGYLDGLWDKVGSAEDRIKRLEQFAELQEPYSCYYLAEQYLSKIAELKEPERTQQQNKTVLLLRHTLISKNEQLIPLAVSLLRKIAQSTPDVEQKNGDVVATAQLILCDHFYSTEPVSPEAKNYLTKATLAAASHPKEFSANLTKNFKHYDQFQEAVNLIYSQNQADQAVGFKKLLKLAEENQDTNLSAICYRTAGYSYSERNSLEGVIDCYYRAAKIDLTEIPAFCNIAEKVNESLAENYFQKLTQLYWLDAKKTNTTQITQALFIIIQKNLKEAWLLPKLEKLLPDSYSYHYESTYPSLLASLFNRMLEKINDLPSELKAFLHYQLSTKLKQDKWGFSEKELEHSRLALEAILEAKDAPLKSKMVENFCDQYTNFKGSAKQETMSAKKLFDQLVDDPKFIYPLYALVNKQFREQGQDAANNLVKLFGRISEGNQFDYLESILKLAIEFGEKNAISELLATAILKFDIKKIINSLDYLEKFMKLAEQIMEQQPQLSSICVEFSTACFAPIQAEKELKAAAAYKEKIVSQNAKLADLIAKPVSILPWLFTEKKKQAELRPFADQSYLLAMDYMILNGNQEDVLKYAKAIFKMTKEIMDKNFLPDFKFQEIKSNAVNRLTELLNQPHFAKRAQDILLALPKEQAVLMNNTRLVQTLGLQAAASPEVKEQVNAEAKVEQGKKLVPMATEKEEFLPRIRLSL